MKVLHEKMQGPVSHVKFPDVIKLRPVERKPLMCVQLDMAGG